MAQEFLNNVKHRALFHSLLTDIIDRFYFSKYNLRLKAR